MSEVLHEYVDSRGVAMRVDRQAGVIHGVKILGLVSRNGRTYPAETLVQAAPLYEGAKVNVNHARSAAGSPRDYQDRIGSIRNVAVRPEEGLFADFHFNPKHALAEQLLWDAQHAPENVGFSHNVEARTVRRGDRVLVEAITKVQSVDLVADPATTEGLFESETTAVPATVESSLESETAAVPTTEELPPAERTARLDKPAVVPGESAAAPPEPDWAGMTLVELRRHRPDLVEAALRESREAERGRPKAREQSPPPVPLPFDVDAFVRAIT